ncbi:MAG: GGDEF domain-containing protein [Defluviitaleaceae bacterium]|nr:GGDEF domain-containing protein [Defluviitaleaceae bacterium]
MENGAQKKKRLHFGVMFSTMDNTNQHDIWRGIVDFANENDIHLTAYIGTYQSEDNSVTSFLETCFNTISTSKILDGVILMSGFLAQNVGLEKFSEHMATLPNELPKVSVSYSMPGIPSVLADGFNGIYNAVEHLIKTHGKKKIAFVKGPDGHPEAEERLSGYKKALEDNGIDVDENYIFPGVFIWESGLKAADELYDVRGLTVDAIVACNDQMAMGVLTGLRNRDILVPADVAVTGFDDDVVSATFIPSLSTARQDFFEIGKTGAEMLLRIVSGETVEEIKYVPPVFVNRQSCGCIEEEYSPEKSLLKFYETLAKYNHIYRDLSVWQKAQNIINMDMRHNDERESAQSAISTILSATAFVHDIIHKEEKNQKVAHDGMRNYMSRITTGLVLTFNMDAVIDRLFSSLPGQSLSTVLIGVYRNPVKSADTNANRIIETLLGFDGDKKFNVKHNSWNPILFSDYATFEHFDFDYYRRTMFFVPLAFEDEEVGVILLPFERHIPLDSYESLRVSVAAAIKGAELLSTIQTLSVTDELTGLFNRRGFFQFVYSRMQHLRRSQSVLPFLMFMDMDGLKAINDTYGHQEGDVAITAFAQVLRSVLREEDIIGRLGGDEFTVFSTVKSVENGKLVVQRIRDKLDEYNAKKLHPYLVAGSIGSVILDDLTKECFEAAMLSADSILYEEKMEKKKKGLSRQ